MLDPKLQKLIDEQKEGINVKLLKPGTVVEVKTENSNYHIEVTKPPHEVYLQGGEYFHKKKKVIFTGSTWGGSILKIGWIGKDMFMEFHIEDRILTTSAVVSAKIIADNWEYELWGR